MLQSSPTPNWLSPQGSSSGLIVKKTVRVDIPVDTFPNVWRILSLPQFMLNFILLKDLLLTLVYCSLTLLVAF